jgi:hypothetical protein
MTMAPSSARPRRAGLKKNYGSIIPVTLAIVFAASPRQCQTANAIEKLRRGRGWRKILELAPEFDIPRP